MRYGMVCDIIGEDGGGYQQQSRRFNESTGMSDVECGVLYILRRENEMSAESRAGWGEMKNVMTKLNEYPNR